MVTTAALLQCSQVTLYVFKQLLQTKLIWSISSELVAEEERNINGTEGKAKAIEASSAASLATHDDKEPQFDLIASGEVDKGSKLDNMFRHKTLWLEKLAYDPVFEARLIQERVLKETHALKIRKQTDEIKEKRKFLAFARKYKSPELYDAVKKALADTSQYDLVQFLEGRQWDDANSTQSGKM